MLRFGPCSTSTRGSASIPINSPQRKRSVGPNSGSVKAYEDSCQSSVLSCQSPAPTPHAQPILDLGLETLGFYRFAHFPKKIPNSKLFTSLPATSLPRDC